MTFCTLLGKPTTTFCVVCWPEEENTLSIVSSKKIVSPSQDDLAPETFCKVKGFESHLCKIVAVGNELEMKKRIKTLEVADGTGDGSQDLDEPPPPKKRCVEKASKWRKKKDKENKTPSRSKKMKNKGSIIIVTAQTQMLFPLLPRTTPHQLQLAIQNPFNR